MERDKAPTPTPALAIHQKQKQNKKSLGIFTRTKNAMLLKCHASIFLERICRVEKREKEIEKRRYEGGGGRKRGEKAR